VLEAKLQHLPLLFPEWKEIDAKQPAKSLEEYLIKK
jgi:hypothetical protein